MARDSTRLSLLVRLRDTTDQAAWSEFDARYRDLILAHCRRRGLQAADAEDVRQLVLLGFSRAAAGFRYDPAHGRFRDYLGRIVQNAVGRIQRHPGAATSQLDQAELEQLALDEGGGPDEGWETDWMHHHLRLALEKVRQHCEPDTLAVFERIAAGELATDVARSTGKSIDAVYKIVQRLRDRLQEEVARQVEEEDSPGAD